jgi:hypothetical protein
MLNIKPIFPLLLLGFVASATAPKAAKAPADNRITGDYVEARTASVFAGACHYNGELVTSGRNAIMAWRLTSGTWKGVDLTGVTAMGNITSDANLGDESAARKTELIINTSATPAQSAAMVDLLRSRCGEHLGNIVAVHSAPVNFVKNGRSYDVNAPGFADLSVQPMPNDECCSQPSMVWYSPLIQLQHRKVGYTLNADYSAGTNGDQWDRSDENSAFYGAFDF